MEYSFADLIKGKKTRQKHVRQKNKELPDPFFIFLSHMFLSGLASFIIDITGVPGGTVYPALRRLEDEGYLTSEWEEPSIAQSEPRPPRKYYELTREGRELLAEAVKRYRLLEQTQPKKERAPKPSRA